MRSQIRGGKGGFGTLLKGQSRQAAAKATTDFSACRDLQGRRLRHVNDAIHYSVWKEWNDKVQAGTATLDEMAAALSNTDSGIAGWHLQLPAWADVSAKKEHQRTKNQLRNWKREREAAQQRQQQHRERQERQVAAYVQAADDATAQLEGSVAAALQQGLLKKKKAAREAQQEGTAHRSSSSSSSSPAQRRRKTEPEPPACLLTLSGDAVLAVEASNNDDDNDDDRWRLQSQSNFCTAAIVLDSSKVAAASVLYWELRLVTGGLVQVGWATTTGFRPQSETGDGVGDCAHSWGWDGSRALKLHNETTETYGSLWKAGDVVGCRWDCRTGQLSYSLNGQDCGVAFTVPSGSKCIPVVSCNPGEIVELRLQAKEMEYFDASGANDNQDGGVVAVGAVVATEDVSLESFLLEQDATAEDDGKQDEKDRADKKPAAIAVAEDKSNDEKKAAATVVAEPLTDLDKYESTDELEKLGLDRLKGALMAMGLKCGGTLHERAARLMAVRGLDPQDYPAKLLAKKR